MRRCNGGTRQRERVGEITKASLVACLWNVRPIRVFPFSEACAPEVPGSAAAETQHVYFTRVIFWTNVAPFDRRT
jgi:hypothetical protein